MRRNSAFAIAAESWLIENAPDRVVSTVVLWSGLRESAPELTASSPGRRTPRSTCMRDLRQDSRFVVRGGTIKLATVGDADREP
jgi:hypothetical protein